MQDSQRRTVRHPKSYNLRNPRGLTRVVPGSKAAKRAAAAAKRVADAAKRAAAVDAATVHEGPTSAKRRNPRRKRSPRTARISALRSATAGCSTAVETIEVEEERTAPENNPVPENPNSLEAQMSGRRPAIQRRMLLCSREQQQRPSPLIRPLEEFDDSSDEDEPMSMPLLDSDEEIDEPGAEAREQMGTAGIRELCSGRYNIPFRVEDTDDDETPPHRDHLGAEEVEGEPFHGFRELDMRVIDSIFLTNKIVRKIESQIDLLSGAF